MNSTKRVAGSAEAPATTVHETISPNWAGSVESGPDSAVTTPVLSTRKRGSAAHSGQLVEDERRPDHRRRLAREVGGPGGVGVLRAGHRGGADQVVVEGERRLALRAVQRDGARGVDQLTVVRQRHVLEGLLGEGVARRGGAHEPR